MSIVANKFKGVRAVLCENSYAVKYSRLHNNANAACFGGRVLGNEFAVELLDIFLNIPFEKGRHEQRLETIAKLEKEKIFK